MRTRSCAGNGEFTAKLVLFLFVGQTIEGTTAAVVFCLSDSQLGVEDPRGTRVEAIQLVGIAGWWSSQFLACRSVLRAFSCSGFSCFAGAAKKHQRGAHNPDVQARLCQRECDFDLALGFTGLWLNRVRSFSFGGQLGAVTSTWEHE